MKANTYTEHKQASIKDVPCGEYIRLNEHTSKTWQRGHYCRETRKYSLLDCDDMNREIFRSGSALVWVGFTY